MKHEKIIEKIKQTIDDNRIARIYGVGTSLTDDALRRSNDILAQARTIIKNTENDYERGCEDAWELARKIVGDTNAYTLGQLSDIFDNLLIEDIFDGHTYQEALAKVEAYEQKKKEEAEKPVVGDVVECVYKYDASRRFKGIVRDIEDDHIYIITKEYTHVTVLLKSEFDIKKTGKHVDIQGMLDAIE